MGSVTSALTRTRNALVKVGSEPENNESDRTRSAPESDRAKKKSARFNASSQTGRQSSRASLSEVLSRPDSGGGRQSSKKKTTEGQQSGNSNHSVCLKACCCCSCKSGHSYHHYCCSVKLVVFMMNSHAVKPFVLLICNLYEM